MRLVNCRDYLTGARSLRELYRNLILIEINKSKLNEDLAFKQFLSIFTEEELHEALNSITFKNGYLEAPEHTRFNLILRYLEYGGEGAKPTHILSKAKQSLIRNFNMKEN